MYKILSIIILSLFVIKNSYTQQVSDSIRLAEFRQMDTLGLADLQTNLDSIYDFPAGDCSKQGASIIYFYTVYSIAVYPLKEFEGKEYMKHKVVTIQMDSIFSLNIFESFQKQEIIPSDGWVNLVREIRALNLGSLPATHWDMRFAIPRAPDGNGYYLKFCHERQEKVVSLINLELATTDDPELLPLYFASANYKGQVMKIFDFFEKLEN